MQFTNKGTQHIWNPVSHSGEPFGWKGGIEQQDPARLWCHCTKFLETLLLSLPRTGRGRFRGYMFLKSHAFKIIIDACSKKCTSTKLMHHKAQTCASCVLTISRAIRMYQKSPTNYKNDLTSYPLKHQSFAHFGHFTMSQRLGITTSWGLILWPSTESTESLGGINLPASSCQWGKNRQVVMKGNHLPPGTVPYPIKFGTFESMMGFTMFYDFPVVDICDGPLGYVRFW